MNKKIISISVMLAGIILFVLEVTVFELSGAPGFLLVICSLLMTIGGVISICIINWNKKENIELGVGIFEIVMDVVLALLWH